MTERSVQSSASSGTTHLQAALEALWGPGPVEAAVAEAEGRILRVRRYSTVCRTTTRDARSTSRISTAPRLGLALHPSLKRFAPIPLPQLCPIRQHRAGQRGRLAELLGAHQCILEDHVAQICTLQVRAP